MTAVPTCSVSELAGMEPALGGIVPEDDLSQRDLSEVADEDLTPAERHELQRRLGDFVTRLHERAGLKARAKKKPKRISRWEPKTISRRR